MTFRVLLTTMSRLYFFIGFVSCLRHRDHSILLSRLRDCFGVNGTALAWFESYLTSRKQLAQVNAYDCGSTQRSLERGVLHGSVLDPLLYLLYTSSIANIIKLHKLQYYLYADYTQLYISFKTECSWDLSLAKRRVECCVNTMMDGA